jgi:hypothetical protein
MTRGQVAGLVTSVLVALAVLWLAVDSGWTWRLGFEGIGAGRDWDGWPLFSKLVLVGSWINLYAWAARKWLLAVVCSTLTFFAPWGLIYPGILAGPILAIAAGLAWARTKSEG